MLCEEAHLPRSVENRYYDVLHLLAFRYSQMSEDEILSTFINEFQKGVDDHLPLMKLNRWLGYIQGVLIERGRTTVEKERDYTRPLFRPLDFPDTNLM